MAERIQVLGLAIDAVDIAGAVERVMALAVQRKESATAATVFTPNLDHIVRLRKDNAFHLAYRSTDVVLADGFPIVLASRLSGRPLPQRVAGSDLVLPLCAAAARQRKTVFFLGTSFDILAVAARRLVTACPNLELVGVFAPGRGFDVEHEDSPAVIDMINGLEPDLLFLALGSPRQELWAAAVRDGLRVGAVVCVGAAFDFLAGKPHRAPRLMQQLCLEWLWRLIQEPGKLARRYASNIVHLPLLLVDEWRRPILRPTAPPAE